MATLMTFESSRLRQPHVVGCFRLVFAGAIQQRKGMGPLGSVTLALTREFWPGNSEVVLTTAEAVRCSP